MKGLLLVAHGSRKPETRDEIARLTERVADSLGGAFDVVDFAFLQWSQPAIPEQLDAFASRGVTEITVLPYLLATGSHVAADIPDAIQQVAERHPDVRIHLIPHIGRASGMVALIGEHVRGM